MTTRKTTGQGTDPKRRTFNARIGHLSLYALFPAAATVAQDDGRAKAREKFLSPALIDGINDVATFGPDAAEVEIFAVSGRRVFSGSRESSSAIIWNCRDGSGRIVESGVYIAKIRKTDGSTTYQGLSVAK